MPGTPTPQSEDRAWYDRRWRRLGAGAGGLVAGRVVTAACGLIQLPIVLDALGPEGLGLWLALSGLLWSLAIFDCGLGFATQNRVGALLASHRTSEADALIRWSMRRLQVLALIVSLTGLLLAFTGDWNRWFNVTDATLKSHTACSVAIVFAIGAFAIPFSLASRVAASTQQMWITGMWTAIGSALGLLGVAIARMWHASLTGFVLAACVAPFVPHLGTWLQLRRTGNWFRAVSSTATSPAGLGREAILFFTPQLGSAFISTFTPTLVTLFAGPAATAVYGVLQRLFGFGGQLHLMALTPTWPAYTQAAATGDVAFARRTFHVSWIFTLLVFVVPTVCLAPFVPALVRVWLGADAPAIDPLLLWLMTAWHVAQFCGQPIAMLLNGVGRMESLAALGWIGIATTLALCRFLGPALGAAGVMFSLLVPYLLLNLPVTGWQARRALRAIANQSGGSR